VGTWYGNQLKGLARAAAPDDIRALAARIQDHLSRPVSAGLREHQREALSAIARRLGTTGASPTSITVIPTAGGKTRIFLHLVAAANLNASVPHRTIMLVPTRELIGQTWREMREHFPGLDLGYVASEEILDAAGDRVPRRVAATTLMTYQRFMRLAEAGKLSPDDVDLVVMDEAHRALSDLRQDVIAEFKDRVVMAAFSATPAFDDEKSLHSLLGAENQTLMVTPKRLRDAGVIAPVVNLVMGVSLKGRLPRDARESTLVRRKALVDAALDLVETHVDDELGIALKDKVALFYGTDIAHARMFVEEYNARFGGAGRGAVLVTGADGPEHLRGAVEGVRRGTVGAFGNAQMLVEGFDLPEIGLAINAPTQSLVKQLQQSGRAQRIDPALPADDVRQTAYVLDSYFRINGRIVGSPRFYFDAVDDVSTARMIELPARDVGAVDVGGYLDLPGFDPTNGCADGKEAPDPAGADAVLTGAGDALPGPLGPDATAGGAAPGPPAGSPRVGGAPSAPSKRAWTSPATWRPSTGSSGSASARRPRGRRTAGLPLSRSRCSRASRPSAPISVRPGTRRARTSVPAAMSRWAADASGSQSGWRGSWPGFACTSRISQRSARPPPFPPRAWRRSGRTT
jgi:superfamily II DNA or RNA helicase